MVVTGTEVVCCLRMDEEGDGEEKDGGGDGIFSCLDWPTSICFKRFCKSDKIKIKLCAFEQAKKEYSVGQCICQDKHLNKHTCDVSLTDDQSSDQIVINSVSTMFVCLPLLNINTSKSYGEGAYETVPIHRVISIRNWSDAKNIEEK